MKSGPAVLARGISKHFRLYHERPLTLKERVVNLRRSRYELFWALKDVSMEIEHGETAGLIGPNGSGKSTLLKLIARIIRPDDGVIQTDGRVASLLELGAGFHPDLTGRENVYMNASILGISRKETDRYFDEIVAFAELEQFIHMQVRHYSSGMYVRLGFAVAVHVDPEILLVDEVLAVGDEAFQRKCMDKIRAFQREGRTIIFVTHAVDIARTICHKVYFLHHGRVAAAGSPADVIRSFRQTIHGEAHLEAAATEERGTREVQITSVTFVDTNGVARQVFAPGEAIEIRVSLESIQPVSDPVVGLALYDERDVLLFGTNTAINDIKLGTIDRRLDLVFRLKEIPLLNGKVQVTLGVHSRDERSVYHWLEKQSTFQVVNPGADVGTLRFPLEILVEDFRS